MCVCSSFTFAPKKDIKKIRWLKPDFRVLAETLIYIGCLNFPCVNVCLGMVAASAQHAGIVVISVLFPQDE